MLNTRDSSTPEQEILLNKGTALEILHVSKSKPVTEIQCRVVKQG